MKLSWDKWISIRGKKKEKKKKPHCPTYNIYKINSRRIIDLNIKAKVIRLLRRENTGKYETLRYINIFYIGQRKH